MTKYYTEAEIKRISYRIGHFVSMNLVWKDGINSELLSPKELNDLNRITLAETFIESMHWHHEKKVKRLPDSNELRDEILEFMAVLIDSKIPQKYHKYMDSKSSSPSNSKDWSLNDYGLIYHYNQNNIEKEQNSYDHRFETPITCKQKKYLISLLEGSGYQLNVDIEELNIAQAILVISFFVEDKEYIGDIKELISYDVF